VQADFELKGIRNSTQLFTKRFQARAVFDPEAQTRRELAEVYRNG